MSKKSKIVIARIMAILMVISILPAEYLGAASVVMAEELEESVDADAALDDAGELNNDSYPNVDGPVSVGGIQEEVIDETDASGEKVTEDADVSNEGTEEETKEDTDVSNEETPEDAGSSDSVDDDSQQSEEPSEDAETADEEIAAELSEDVEADVPLEAAVLGNVELKRAEGYEEGAYAEWKPYSGADGYVAYVSTNKDSFTESDRIDNELIREYSDHWRVDTVGLAKGTYYIKVSAVTVDDSDKKTLSEIATVTTGALTVTNYDRSGFAFSSQSPVKTASGAYNEDGTLKSGAKVVYVTGDTAKTCKATIAGTEYTGLQAILDAKQKSGTSNEILDIRIIGCIYNNNLDAMFSSEQGLQVKGNSARTNMNLTIEGIGEDATVWGFGFLIRNCANVEFRNFGILRCMDDGVSIDTDNCNLWMHDLDIFYGKQGSGDKAKGDGALDIKKSQYCTVSYIHFWDTGKCCLLDAQEASSGGSNYITYHHNWFDHSDSRHPRVRNASAVHVYNNYFDGNAKYGVGATTGSSTFVEANYFRNSSKPMLIAAQGTDVAGTTFKERGGMIKAYNNHIEGATSYHPYSSTNNIEFDSYEVTNKSDPVPSSVTTKNGDKYSNFDTESTMYTYTADSPEVAKQKVEDHAGRLGRGDLQWTFDYATEDSNYDIIPGLQSAIGAYKPSVKVIGGIDGVVVSSSGGNSSGGETGGGDNTGGTTTPGEIASEYIHNFTESGTTSSFYTITGDMKDKPAAITYNGITLTEALKLEDSTSITFNAPSSGTLTLVHDTAWASGKGTKVDGKKYTHTAGIVTVTGLASGPHTITKGDSTNLYYISFKVDVEAPVASLPTGSQVTKGTEVTLSCATDGASIRYTTDGTDPGATSGTLYSGAITINAETTIKAIAVKGDKTSGIVAFHYTVEGTGGGNQGGGTGGGDEGGGDQGDPTIKYTITVDPDNGSATTTITKNKGEKIDASEMPPEPKKDGCTFIAWVDASGNIIQFPYEPTGDMTIKAKWEKNAVGDETHYAITVNKADGSQVSVINLDKGKELTKELLPDPTREGYEFTGWINDKTGAEVTLPFTPDSDMVLKATWKSLNDDDDQTGIQIIKLAAEYTYTGAKITPAFDVVDYAVKGGQYLAQGSDYTVKYANNKDVGTAEITVTGKGNYQGKGTTATFAIVEPKAPEGVELADLKGAKITKIETGMPYTGKAQYPKFSLKLKDGSDVEYTYTDGWYKTAAGEVLPAKAAVSNNINKGTATILLTGANGSNGKVTTVKKTFKIAAVNLNEGDIKVVVNGGEAVPYGVKGAVPSTIEVKYNDELLKKGRDYTVKYSSNKKAGATGTVVITGKGNYTKAYKGATFNIAKLDLETRNVSAVMAYDGIKVSKVKATVVDNQGNALKPAQYTLSVYKAAGKTDSTDNTDNTDNTEKAQDTENTDNNENTENTDNTANNGSKDAVLCDATDILNAGDVIYVVATAKDTNNLDKATLLAGAKKFTVGTNISKAKVGNDSLKTITVPYTGNPVTLEPIVNGKGDLKVNLKGVGDLKPGEDYIIVEETYANNVNKGTASVVIQGIGKYSGTKTVKFKITPKSIENITVNRDTAAGYIKNFFNKIFN